MTGHQLAMALRRAYLAMHRRTDAALVRHGVTADQFVLLTALADGHAVTQRELAARTASDKNTVRAMLVLLEKRGLVARDAHPADARARAVTLTAAGRRVHSTLWAAVEEIRTRLAEATGAVAPEAALELLERLTHAMAQPDARRTRS